MKQAATFTERTKQFWDWFTANEKKLSDMVQNRNERGNNEADVEFISEGVSILSEAIHFNIGGDHEFTFAVSGDSSLFFLLPYVTANLPEQFRNKWTFFPCMQGTDGQNFSFNMYDIMVDSDEVMVFAVPNGESKTADLFFYAKEWETLEDNSCYNAFYILMELVVGEALAHTCINDVGRTGSIEDGMFPLTQLEQWLTDHFLEDEEPPNPAERYFGYDKEPENSLLPREDIILGITSHFSLLNDYSNGEEEAYQFFEELGAKPVFLYYYFDDGEIDHRMALENRNVIIDKLEAEVLGERGSGQETGLVLGWALGERCAYIDLLLYDEHVFRERAEATLAETPHMVFCKEFKQDGQEILLTGRSAAGFTERLQQLAACDAFDKISEIIEDLPSEQRDHTINSIYFQALSDLEEYRREAKAGRTTIKQLQKWHNNNNHLKIIEAVEAIPESERDFERIKLLARAYTNRRLYNEAYTLLSAYRAEGENDALWNWRMGCSLCETGQRIEAIPYLKRAIKLGDDHPETARYLQMAERALKRKGVPYKKQVADLEKEYIGAGLGKHWNSMKGMLRNAIDIGLIRCDENDLPRGTSKIGGLPDLPKNVEWFTHNGEPMMFIAQINFAETKPFDIDGLLPDSGILYLFYSIGGEWGHDPEHKDNKRVYYYNGDMGVLERKRIPEDLPEGCRFPAAKPAFDFSPNMPDIWSSLLNFELADEEAQSFLEMHDSYTRINKLLGHSDNIQDGMEWECELVTNGLNPAGENGYEDPRAVKLKANAPKWRLLLQIDSNSESDMLWGDEGRIYLWILEDALLRRDFENTWLIIQCY